MYEPHDLDKVNWPAYRYTLSSESFNDAKDYNAVYGLLQFDDPRHNDAGPIGFVGYVTNTSESPMSFEYVVAGATRYNAQERVFGYQAGTASKDLWKLFSQSGAAESNTVPKIPLVRTDPKGSIALATSENGQLIIRSRGPRHVFGSSSVNNYIAFFPRQ